MRYALFGTLFGFILARVGATDYAAIAGMFTLTDLHLMGVIGVAVVVAAIGIRVMRARGVTTVEGAQLPLTPKAMKPGLVLGSALFGIGWGLSGTCPGTGLAQIGEGRLIGLFTVAGIVVGTVLYGRVGPLVEARLLALRRG